MTNRRGNSGNSGRLLFFGAPKSLQMVTTAMKLKDAYSLEEKGRIDGERASGPITSWQIDGETVETVADFILGCVHNLGKGVCF